MKREVGIVLANQDSQRFDDPGQKKTNSQN